MDMPHFMTGALDNFDYNLTLTIVRSSSMALVLQSHNALGMKSISHLATSLIQH